MSADPESDEFLIFTKLYYKKRGILYLPLIPHTRPSHCLRSRISNAEAHANMLYVSCKIQDIINILMNIYYCFTV